MGGPIYDCLNNPLAAVRTLFENAAKQADSPKDLGCGDWGVKELFDNWIAREGNLERIPELNSVQLHLLAPGSLVRYRGMVQDMLNMEYYMGAYRGGNPDSWRTCKFTDVGDVVDDQAIETQIWDRKLLYCVPVPGESWVRESTGCAPPPLRVHPTEASQRPKREREEDSDMAVDGKEEGRVEEDGKRQVYDSGAESELKLNEVVEFVGVLALDSVVAGGGLGGGDGEEEGDGDGDMMAGMDVNAILPPNRVPRLHCITMRSLGGKPRLDTQISNEVHEGVRSSLLSRLAALLGGDRLGAEALLLHMLARVHLRAEPLAIGKLALNLFGFKASDPSLPQGIAVAMALLLPRAHRVGLSITTLNSAPFAPRKDYASDRLATGVLQLAEGTHLTLDETELESGQLSAVGVGNVESLKTLIEWQKVEYDFEYYKVDMAADISVLLLSEARSRLLSADVAINVKPISDPMLMSADEPELSMWRQYLSAARYMEHSVPAGIQKILEQDLVDARKEDRSLGPETFHRWLTLARLQSLSYGERELKEQRWREVRQFERLCEARLRVGF